MARIAGVSPHDAGLGVKLARYFTRRQLAQITGRETEQMNERMTEPVEVYAHAPGVLSAYGKLEQATAKLNRVEWRLKVLAELKAATLTNCEYCIDLGSQVARRTGLTDDQLLALPRYRESGLFDEVEKLVLDYAVGMSRTPVEVPDVLFDRLKERFDDAQIVELTHAIALENLRGRFNLALGVGAAGFSEGMVCALPTTVALQEALLADSVGLALLVVLETLTPAERLAFVLHDTFAMPFDEIAPIVGRSPAATRQLASRARRRVRGATAVPDADLARQQEVVGAFLTAAREGDFGALLTVLDPDVVLRADTGGPPREVRGARAVANQALTFSRLGGPGRVSRPVLVNGAAGVVSQDPDGRPFSVMGFTVSGGRIVEIDILANPERLSKLDLSALDN